MFLGGGKWSGVPDLLLMIETGPVSDMVMREFRAEERAQAWQWSRGSHRGRQDYALVETAVTQVLESVHMVLTQPGTPVSFR